MLSFDITDRHIRIVRGSENNGNIKVMAAMTIEVDEGIIVNGHIKDIPRVATLISDELKAKKIVDKEALVCMSSNLVVFRELHVPKAKGAQLYRMIRNQLQHTMGMNDDYAVSYTIAGEVEEEGSSAFKVLATACPAEIVDSFRKVFTMLSIQLKSVAISCSCISRVIFANKTNREKMPLLVVQIDSNFISLNLYENNQLAFSRFATIDPLDYDNQDDYVYEAVMENVLRMLQFQRSRGASEQIENVMFYGDTQDFNRLTNEVERMDLKASLVSVPSHISGYENIEFQHYANAVGAMYKRQRDIEKINLLELDGGGSGMGTTGSFAVAAIGTAAACALVVAAVYVGFTVQGNMIDKDIQAIDDYINSEEVAKQLEVVTQTSNMINKVNEYTANAQIAYDAYLSQPVIHTEVLNKIESCLPAGVEIPSFSYGLGNISFTLSVPKQTDPADIIENIINLDYFASIPYMGYTTSLSQESNKETSTFNINLIVDNGEYNNIVAKEGGDAE